MVFSGKKIADKRRRMIIISLANLLIVLRTKTNVRLTAIVHRIADAWGISGKFVFSLDGIKQLKKLRLN